MNRNVNTIANRLSLRPPQRESLEILARVAEIATLGKGTDPKALLEVIRSEYPTVQDFERDFPSLCFHLATGVGKTRLMGAFIAWLHAEGISRHFFVLAPNLTIYNKLIADFTAGTPKYVFAGLSSFAMTPPVVITGDNYESGIGVRTDARSQLPLPLPEQIAQDTGVHINVFNIAKINSEVRGGKSPRIKRLAEYIGESYFEYLAALPDLVLLMDESHRYRADAGVKAINDLNPILGLELTATPFTERAGKPVPFKNVVYSYPLGRAIADAFVKIPAVATRRDFDANQAKEIIEGIKLRDGVLLHEEIKTGLGVYATQTGKPRVKPFMLVVARDTAHAKTLHETIASDAFFRGQYRDKVIEIHSNQGAEEKDENIQKLLAVESPEEPTEIVIHVDMLKEGWDVTNLFTIVPLRAANARTLIEQSIGRGLRLPYGRRIGDDRLDRLTIVAHDHFGEIIAEARKPDSVVQMTEIILDADGPPPPTTPTTVEPTFVSAVLATAPGAPPATEEKKAVVAAVVQAIATQQHLAASRELLRPDVQAAIVAQVQAALPKPQQQGLPYQTQAIREITLAVLESFVERTIDVPRITVQASGDISTGYHDFDLDLSSVHQQPVDEVILIQHLNSDKRELVGMVNVGAEESKLENYVVRDLVAFADVDYDTHADLLYKLAGQLVTHLRSYLPDDAAVRNVLLYYAPTLAGLVHAQLEKHRFEHGVTYELKVVEGFTRLTSATFSAPVGVPPRPYRQLVADKSGIVRMTFSGFLKCLYPVQKFDVDPERRFAIVLENDESVLRWVKPVREAFEIYLRGGKRYQPDFVVETKTARWICEVKRADYMDDAEVLEKARAAMTWCKAASAHTATTDGKPWRYLLVPDTEIAENMTLLGLAGKYEKRA